MARLVRFLLAAVALPFAWGLSRSFVDVFRLMSTDGDGIVSPGALSVMAGFVLHLLLWMTCPKPVRLYVLGHELTHAFFGVLFGARVSNLRVGLQGGSVTLTKSNVLITLAPYFFPFYAILVMLAAFVVRVFVSPMPFPCAWLFAVGLAWCFHVCFTIRSLAQEQPDIKEYGYLFSYVFIWISNVLGMAVGIVCTTGISWRMFVRGLYARSLDAYSAVGVFFVWVYESLRALPVLQG